MVLHIEKGGFAGAFLGSIEITFHFTSGFTPVSAATLFTKLSTR